mmetsp:Transcript_5161/g.8458  ORF Transcript_5161/g.8458 Transcript_5161/m.8458 type:complete len:168 (+) Transcript_5161:483-986(+)
MATINRPSIKQFSKLSIPKRAKLKIVFNFHHHHPSPSPIHELKRKKRKKRDNQSNNNDVKHLHHWRAIHTAGNLHTHTHKREDKTRQTKMTSLLVDGVKIINLLILFIVVCCRMFFLAATFPFAATRTLFALIAIANCFLIVVLYFFVFEKSIYFFQLKNSLRRKKK